MELILNIIVLIFEVIFYSLFMKFTRKEGKLWKYIVTFILMTILVLICNATKFPVYFAFVIMTLLALKYIVRIKVTLYDMLVIVLMLFLKMAIETPLYIVLFKFINNYVIGVIVNIIKIVVIFLLRNKLNKFYNFLKVKWDNNNFYIRYIFSICCFIYCIITAILLIKYSIG